jgi:hypothetical protein
MAQLLSEEGGASSSQAKWAVGDQWIKSASDSEVSWKVEPSYFQTANGKGLTGVVLSEKGQSLRAMCFPLAENRWQARLGNWFLPVRRVPPKSAQAGPVHHKLTALVAGRIHSVLFREGAWIPAHESALLVESLGMLIPHALPVDVRLVRWHIGAEDQVYAGQVLAEFERAPQVR